MAWTHAGRWSGTVTTRSGRPAPDVAVTIHPDEDLASEATVYADRNKTGTVPNPVATDGLGNLAVWLEPGYYTGTTDSGGVFDLVVPVDPVDVAAAATAPGVASYTLTAVSSWLLEHAHPYPPDVVLLDAAGQLVDTDLEHPDSTHVHLTFAAPFTGRAIVRP